MERRKLTKEDIDRVRSIDGFPIGKDDDIIALSDAPYYTACPNPFIEEFIKENGTLYNAETDEYHCEPYASDVSEGKGDAIYVAHSYHTKVPHKAIMRYILHYTKPGDIVLDGFCGSGMTGVAAQMCGTPDSETRTEFDLTMKNIKWGARKAILTDLSPLASNMAYHYNEEFDYDQFEKDAKDVLDDCEKKYGWMFKTKHTQKSKYSLFADEEYGTINHIVWSDVFVCPHCGKEFKLWDCAVDFKNKEIKDLFLCSNCGAELAKGNCEHAKISYYDEGLKEVVTLSKQVPVLIVYTADGERFEKKPDEYDFELLERINKTPFDSQYPLAELPEGVNTEQPKKSHNIKYVHQFYTKRNLMVISYLRECLKKKHLAFEYTAMLPRASKQLRFLASNYFNGGGGWVGTALSGTLYIPSFSMETNILLVFKNRITRSLSMSYAKKGNVFVSNQSTTNLCNIPNNSIDYIFTDPPFGANLNYSELSYIWETWLKIYTNNKCEAIMNDVQGKALLEYQGLMEQCFKEYNRVLKPNRWITIEFHNSKNAVWNAIQTAIVNAGFVIADVRTLDKKQGSFKQVTSSSAVKQDLIISAYKPSMKISSNTIKDENNYIWNFITEHLQMLPVVNYKNGKIEINSERQAYLLFDRMVAYSLVNGITISLDASDFYKLLKEHFIERDNMYFLPSQINEYENARITSEVERIQMALFVTNEKTAIAWLYNELSIPKTYAEIQPSFMQEVRKIDKHEIIPELSVLLEENFLKNDDDKWYIPDRTKEADIAKLREKNLLKDFETYQASRGKIRNFRIEAVRAGFSKLWKEANYKAIVAMAERLPEESIQEDDKLLMYYDLSLSRL